MKVKPMMSEDVYRFLKNLVDPGKFGHAVSAEVRDEARVLLGLGRAEAESYRPVQENNS
jgi:hypothetical protein